MKKKTILVTGGAGFIGSYVNKLLNKLGHKTIILDNLTTGDKRAVISGQFIEGDFGNHKILDQIFSQTKVDLVMHFAASIDVLESMMQPEIYYRNNVVGSLELTTMMMKYGLDKMVYSSTAAIFGNCMSPYISESAEKKPINPYGYTKLVVENMLKDFDAAHQFRSISLRYFNAAGADPDGQLKHYQKTTTHLIPCALSCILNKKPIKIFGTDYDTKDGTCIRDYIHIHDLATAHIKAMEWLLSGGKTDFFNLGYCTGYSVKEVLNAAEKVTGKKLKKIDRPRRAGDPPHLVADSTKAKLKLGWKPQFDSLDTMISHAWQSLI